MDIPANILAWLGSLSPVLTLVVLLVGLHRPAVEAAVAGTAVALATALLSGASAELLGGEIAKGVWSAVSIMLVVFPAVLLYETSLAARGFEAIRRRLTRIIPNRLLQVLALGWCFTGFLQGPSGFGVPVAVVAPLLIGIGVKPMWAVVVPLMGQAWGNTFGTLGLAWDALLQQADSTANTTAAAWWAGIFLWMLNLGAGMLICWFYNRRQGMLEGGPAVAVLSLIQGGGQLLLTRIAPAAAAVIPATLSLLALPLLARLPRYALSDAAASPMFQKPALQDDATSSVPDIHQALLPYYLLVGLMAAVLLVPGVADELARFRTGFSFPRTVTAQGFVNEAQTLYSPVVWFTHSGFFLFTAVFATLIRYSIQGILDNGARRRILADTFDKAVPSCLAVGFLLTMSKIMSGSGQIEIMARGTAALTGTFYGFLAPFVGILGSFMSSSNVSSNILFVRFQESMACLSGAGEALVLAAQTAGAAAGTMISPSKVLLGTTTARITGQEGLIIRKLLYPTLTAGAIMGVVTFCL